LFCLATNEIAQTGLSSLPPVIYYSEQLFSCIGYHKKSFNLASAIQIQWYLDNHTWVKNEQSGESQSSEL